ncbi:MAG: SufB/SufD family protein [Eggerthellaceae bacterium]|jgi:Fe-S cluster assembly protein SufD
MTQTVLNHVNAMPAPTWHRLHMNETQVEIPDGLAPAHLVRVEADMELFGKEDAFDKALQGAQDAWEQTAAYEKTKDYAEQKAKLYEEKEFFDVAARSRYQRRADEIEDSLSLAKSFETGTGNEAYEFLRNAASKPLVLLAGANTEKEATIRVPGVGGYMNVAAIDLIVPDGLEFSLTLATDSIEPGTGLTGTSLRVFAGRGSDVKITRFQTLGTEVCDIDDMGLFLDTDAHVTVEQTVLGGERAYTGLASDLRGENASIEIDLHYLGHKDQVRDFNYSIRHHGPKSQSELHANGVLAGKSKKTLRGTIDLIRGACGAEGEEDETVLLVDEGVENKTVPVILCNEDDVMGNHGATIGHVNADQLFYLACRGLNKEVAEDMFVQSALERAALTAPDEEIREGVLNYARTLIEDFQEVDL